jgi:hypothetical protein
MRFYGGDEVSRAVEIGSPDCILIGRPKDGRQMDDRCNALYGGLQRIRIEQVPLYAGGSIRNSLTPPHQGAAVDSGIHETAQQARAHKTCSTSY